MKRQNPKTSHRADSKHLDSRLDSKVGLKDNIESSLPAESTQPLDSMQIESKQNIDSKNTLDSINAKQNTDISLNIGFLATQMRDFILSHYLPHMEKYQLNHHQCGILWRCNIKPISQISLCHGIQVDKNYIRGLIDELESRGYVLRVKNPKNRKENLITPTELGKEMAQKSFALMLKLQTQILQECGLSAEEIATLTSLLRRVWHGILTQAENDKTESQKK